MKINTSKSTNTVEFDDLKTGDVFLHEGGPAMKMDTSGGCNMVRLSDGQTDHINYDARVTRIDGEFVLA